jgi:hypothetical protein
VSDNKTAYSGKDYPVHSSGPWMEITIETYGDGHREITIDGKRYWVKEKRNFQLSSVGPTWSSIPCRVTAFKVEESCE